MSLGPLNPQPGHRIDHVQEPGEARNLDLSRSNRESVNANQKIKKSSQDIFNSISTKSEGGSGSKINAKPLINDSSSLKTLASKVMTWLTTTSFFSWITNLINGLFASGDLAQKNDLSAENVLHEPIHTLAASKVTSETVLPQTNAILDKIGNNEVENKRWSRRFTIATTDGNTFDRTLREFSSSVKQYDQIIGKRNFKLTINGRVYSNSDHEIADQQLKSFFGIQKEDDLDSETKTPFNIAKYYLTNGVNNLVDDDKFLPGDQLYSEEAQWLSSKNIAVQSIEGLSEINFLESKKEGSNNIFKFEIKEDADISVIDPSSGKSTTLATCRVTKQYTVTQMKDGSSIIEGKKTIIINEK
jgi:hypothetical protein